MEPAPLLPRFCALVVDLALLAAVGVATLVVVGGTGWQLPSRLQTGGALLLTVALLFSLPLLPMAYFTVLHGCGGQTVGKVFYRLRVEDRDGGPLGLGRGFLRAAAQLLTCCTLGIGFAIARFHPRRAALHDLAADSRVVRLPRHFDP